MKSLLLILLLYILSFSDDYTLSITKDPTRGNIGVDDKYLTYTHDSIDDISTIVVDSFEVTAIDNNDNEGRAESYVLIIPTSKLDLYVLNNPLSVIGHNVKKLTGLPMDIGIYNYKEGMIFVLDGDVDITYGRISIFDPVGNLINNHTIFETRTKDNLTFIAIWDGRNNFGRVVGPGSYVVYIEITANERVNPSKYKLPVGFDDVVLPSSLVSGDFTQTFNLAIGVKYQQ